MAVNAADVVAEYRTRLAGRVNQLFALRRGVIDNRWKAELRPVKGARTPFEHSPCTVHRI
ncbi:hypothetical protein ACF9IK_07805 [Kitasatospora hibisci]|uniref:hypothetical protein n=1 Tax=Kitasatospora hibisci TaxID=3369522 RepID=UPI0037550101